MCWRSVHSWLVLLVFLGILLPEPKLSGGHKQGVTSWELAESGSKKLIGIKNILICA